MRNPKVARSSLLQKRNFLISKGLSDPEIQEAFERIGIFSKANSLEEAMDETKINIPTAPPVQSYARVLSTFEKVKDVLSSVALLSGIAYGIYVFYKVS